MTSRTRTVCNNIAGRIKTEKTETGVEVAQERKKNRTLRESFLGLVLIFD
jgi:hypothetical protein